ncbi:MAG: hypothetical protein DRO04_01640 [Candidatus Iainarchaeum archaeon]|uniref:Uncharacterized protein n=1 Tax=Candidatus Iainarchaeum sp. TaxID=3101447 RepID=A0A497JHG8_9ARCH|nr:MAG: hypothetical protein DRO04_01640 [Candidatus Diapherotrites archaeon]
MVLKKFYGYVRRVSRKAKEKWQKVKEKFSWFERHKIPEELKRNAKVARFFWERRGEELETSSKFQREKEQLKLLAKIEFIFGPEESIKHIEEKILEDVRNRLIQLISRNPQHEETLLMIGISEFARSKEFKEALKEIENDPLLKIWRDCLENAPKKFKEAFMADFQWYLERLPIRVRNWFDLYSGLSMKEVIKKIREDLIKDLEEVHNKTKEQNKKEIIGKRIKFVKSKLFEEFCKSIKRGFIGEPTRERALS